MHELDEKFMIEAYKEALLAFDENEVPIGAVLVNNITHKIVARAHNKKEKDKKITSHAEILCIEEAEKIENNWRLDNHTLYVTLEPCTMCASAIIQSRISRVVFGLQEYETGGFGGKIDLTKTFNTLLVVEQFSPNDDIKNLMQKFFKNRRNV